QEVINTSVDEAAQRWPRFIAAAKEEAVGGILAVPLTIPGRTLGSLNIYSPEGHRFTDVEVTTASLLAEQASAVLSNAGAFAEAEQLNGRLREALESRDLIGMAKGILMERESCGPDDAVDILRRASQRS